MIYFARKVLIMVLVLGVAWLGVLSGQHITRQIFHEAVAYAAPKGDPKTIQQQRYKNLELFQKVLHFVESNYVDEVENEKLVHGAIKGMMETLDPHSNFLSKDIFKDMKIDTSGKFGGLGIEIGLKDGVLTVIAPIEDTPAWRAGLKPNDRIVKIDGESTKGLSLMEAVAKMRGKRKTPVKISIYRKGFEKVKDVRIIRDVIKIRAVKHELLEPGIGYIRLSTFNESASKDVRSAIRKLEKKKKLRGLVFDMRNTPGGLLDQAVEVSSLFLKKGVVVSTIGRDPNRKEVKHVRKMKDSRIDFPVAVLVNSSTASAAEIVAGALQDHDRAIVMGQNTFGKGSVQTVIELGHGVGLKLTVARYYTPDGTSIQEKGVVPDINLDEYDPKLLKKAKIERESIRERDLPGHISNEKDKAAHYSKRELENIGKKPDEIEEDPDDMTPIRYNPKEDYQVLQAKNYLKSYAIFKRYKSHEDSARMASQSEDVASRENQ